MVCFAGTGEAVATCHPARRYPRDAEDPPLDPPVVAVREPEPSSAGKAMEVPKQNTTLGSPATSIFPNGDRCWAGELIREELLSMLRTENPCSTKLHRFSALRRKVRALYRDQTSPRQTIGGVMIGRIKA